MIRREAWEVYSKTLAVSLVVFALDEVLERRLRPAIHNPVFCWAAAAGTVQTAAILLLSLALVAVRIYARFRESISEQMRPAIRDRVLALAFEGESWSTVVPSHGPGRQVVEEAIAHSLATLKAGRRERVARFAVESGFAGEWVRAFRSRAKTERKRAVALTGLISPVAGNALLVEALEDKQAAVRAEACRALLVEGDAAQVDRVFRMVVGESLLMRALLADDLKRHAGYLLANTIRAILREGRQAEAARCFEILLAWKRAMPGFDIRPWLGEHEQPAFSRLVLGLLPYVWTDESIEAYVGAHLGRAEVEVRRAAAEAAGRLKLEGLMPQLERALGDDKRVALEAAQALAQMGDAGERCLERAVRGRERGAAAVATEALEQKTVRSR